MKRSIFETLLGAVVIAIAGFFLVFSYRTAEVGAPSNGYEISADFSGIGGLKPGDDVQISGVKVGTVKAVELMQDTYLARVHMDIKAGITLSSDTAAMISSESLLGGRYLLLEPGSEEEMIPTGGRVQFTQAPQNLEQLLGQFIFSMKKEEKDTASQESVSAASAADPAVEEGEESVPAPEAVPPEQVAPEASPAGGPDAAATVPATDEPAQP